MSHSFERYRHWQVRQDAENLLWLGCDRADESSNSLSVAVIQELDEILAEAETKPLRGLILYSAKPDSFILGADIREFDQFDSAERVTDMIRQGHAVFSRLESLDCYKVAAVHGFVLGGGLELALCCDYIMALNTDATRVGLPEVKLGIFPGLGGTTRLTERVGGLPGMQLMLTGRMLRARAARQMGVVDELVDEFSSLRWAARRAVIQRRAASRLSLVARLGNRQPLRTVLAGVLRRKTAEKANPAHYPAPFSMIELWEKHRDDRHRMLEGEAERVGELMVSHTARSLRRLFFLTERLKALGRAEDFPVHRVHVVGAGVMGGDIAAWCVVQGLSVSLQDRDASYIEPAMKRARALFKKRLKRKSAVDAAMARLVADVDGHGIPRADVVIEAIYEDADAKRALYKAIEPRLAAHAILATNTSALPLEDLAREMDKPERLIGLHFFNPVAKMPLVEVVHGKQTDKQWINSACAFCNHINRFPLPTLSSPGFLVNRVLAPYLMEAFTVLLEGKNKELIDRAAVSFGMPMGPVELADVVGLDVCMKVAETLATGDLEAHRQLLQAKIDKGELGKKSGKGFYVWEKGKARRDKSIESVKESEQSSLGLRLIQPLLDECQAASAENIVADDDVLDAGVVFGTGFAPFRGGPLFYLQHRNEAEASS